MHCLLKSGDAYKCAQKKKKEDFFEVEITACHQWGENVNKIKKVCIFITKFSNK